MDEDHQTLTKLNVSLSCIIEKILKGERIYLSSQHELSYNMAMGFVIINGGESRPINISDYTEKDFYIKEIWYHKLPLDIVFSKPFLVINDHNDLFLVKTAKSDPLLLGVMLANGGVSVSADEYRPISNQELGQFLFNTDNF